MGEQFIRKRAQQFQHLQDAAYEQELKTAHLFSARPEVFTVEYPCRPAEGDVPPAGQTVQIRDAAGTAGLEVVYGNRVVGFLDGPGAAGLREILQSEPRCGGEMIAEIRESSPISGFFKIRCAENEN